MASALTFRCPACNARIKTPIKLLGQVRPCPRCKQALRVRIQPPEDAPPALVSDSAEEQSTVISAQAR
jgi:uncharacterized paraquat-inducible protein A